MSRFIIRFMKDVLGENGQVCEICENTIELDAANAQEAEHTAKEQFCAMHGTREWFLHADRVRVDPADFPS